MVIMDDSAPTQEKMKFVKIHKCMLLQKWTLAADVARRPTPKMIKKNQDGIENGHRRKL